MRGTLLFYRFVFMVGEKRYFEKNGVVYEVEVMFQTSPNGYHVIDRKASTRKKVKSWTVRPHSLHEQNSTMYNRYIKQKKLKRYAQRRNNLYLSKK